MADLLTVGDEAPNFDLASTENVVLMLRDEVPRSQVLLYFFSDAEAAAADVEELARRAGELQAQRVKIFGISESPLAELSELQRERHLPFPLLHDDRGFSKRYGSGKEAMRMLALVDKDQRIAWIERDPGDLAAAIGQALTVARDAVSSTVHYPGSVINRLVDRWVN